MARLLVALAVLALLGCSDPPEGMDAGPDEDAGAAMDAGPEDDGGDETDAGPGDDDAGASDAGPSGCPTGQHMCPSGCTDDNANEPAMGCRLGCGEACPVPMGGTASCGTDGMCMASCEAPGVLDGDRCCGGALSCSDGVNFLLACPSPSEEPNDDQIGARLVGTFDDEDGTMEGIGNLALPLGDIDYFRFNVTDSCCSIDTLVRVGLETSAADALELAAWVTCDSGADNHSCTGTSDTTHGFGCVTLASGAPRAVGTLDFDLDCGGTTDEGATVVVRVQATTPATMCHDYDLTWRVFN